MMKRLIPLTCGAAALVFWAGAVSASPYGDEVVAQLARQGFKNIQVETTWLGRERIVADRTDGLREIILNPRSGEILRDTWTAAKGATATRPIVDDVGDDSSGGQGSGKDGSGKDGSDDHQGSGGGSGSGSDGGSDGSGSDGGSDGGGGDHSDGKSGGDGSGGDGSGGDKGSDK